MIFILDLLADLHAIKLLSVKSVKCSFSIINKIDPWLLKYQGAKPVKQCLNTKLNFPKGTSLHTQHWKSCSVIMPTKYMTFFFISSGLKSYLFCGVCFKKTPFKVLSASHSITEQREFKWLLSTSVMLSRTYRVSSETTVVLSYYYLLQKTQNTQ